MLFESHLPSVRAELDSVIARASKYDRYVSDDNWIVRLTTVSAISKQYLRRRFEKVMHRGYCRVYGPKVIPLDLNSVAISVGYKIRGVFEEYVIVLDVSVMRRQFCPVDLVKKVSLNKRDKPGRIDRLIAKHFWHARHILVAILARKVAPSCIKMASEWNANARKSRTKRTWVMLYEYGQFKAEAILKTIEKALETAAKFFKARIKGLIKTVEKGQHQDWFKQKIHEAIETLATIYKILTLQPTDPIQLT